MTSNSILSFPVTRRKILTLGTLPILYSLPSVSYSAPWATHNLYKVSTAGGVFNLPDSKDLLGYVDCDTLNKLAASYRASCANLTNERVVEIQAELKDLTQVQVKKLKTSVDVANVEKLFEYVSTAEGIFLAALGFCTIAALPVSLPVAGIFATTAFVYGFAIGPTIDIVKSSIKTDESGEIIFNWGYKKTVAFAIRAASDAAKEAGKRALGSLITLAAALRNLFNGITKARDGLITAEELEVIVKDTTKIAQELEAGFAELLEDENSVRELVCISAEETAAALEIYTALYSDNDCMQKDVEIHHLQIHHGPVVGPK